MKYQRVPMPPEARQDCRRLQLYVDVGRDFDFGKPRPLHTIAAAVHAAWATPVLHDTRAGLRINARAARSWTGTAR
jgi:hypothetical protein